MQPPSKAQILKRSPVFSSLNAEELDNLADLTTERNFMSSDFIFWEGDAPDWFFIVAEGKVKALKHSSSGKDFIITFFGPGEIFGEVAIFENKPYPASAQAVTETKVLAVKKNDFLSFLGERPQVAMRIISVLGERLRDAQSRLRDFAGERVEQRLASVLVMLSSKLGSTLPFTRQEIADMVGTTIETTIRIMSQLKDREIIRSTRGKVIIINKEKLRILSEGPPRV
ncbi:Crp/Fnr family transcriptional regulator [Chloroflexota bacterium]